MHAHTRKEYKGVAVPVVPAVPEGEERMREKDVEKKLVIAVKAVGGSCPKWVSPGMDGMPDRIVLLPGGRIAFVELKAPGKKPRALQVKRHEELRALGFQVYVIDRQEQIGGVLDAIQTT